MLTTRAGNHGRERWARRPGGAALALAGLVWAAGCGDGGTEPLSPDPSRPAALTVTPASGELAAIGDTLRLTAEVRDQNGNVMTGAEVAWAGGDTSVAAVDSAGLVTAAGKGTATITAASGGAAGTAVVTVAQEVNAVTIVPATDTVAVGDTLRLGANAADANGHAVPDAEFIWASSDNSVAVVDASGLVRGAAEGVATITASSGTARGTAEITVVDADRAVLVALYEATDGPGWIENERWLSDQPIGQWHGVTTGSDGRVTGLRLSANNLVGSIPPELGSLTRLETLDFERNALAGPIPPELGGLASLRSLNLGVNQLTRIPPELGALADLEILRLRRNFLTGPVPPELGNLRNLRRLGLERNRLTGSIPPGFLELDRFQSLHFESNDGLCASGSTDFRAWLTELEIYVGPLCDERDRAVLTSLYETAGGTDWARSDGWLGDGGLNDWYGIDSDSLGRVVGVDLSNNGVTGPRLLVACAAQRPDLSQDRREPRSKRSAAAVTVRALPSGASLCGHRYLHSARPIVRRMAGRDSVARRHRHGVLRPHRPGHPGVAVRGDRRSPLDRRWALAVRPASRRMEGSHDGRRWRRDLSGSQLQQPDGGGSAGTRRPLQPGRPAPRVQQSGGAGSAGTGRPPPTSWCWTSTPTS